MFLSETYKLKKYQTIGFLGQRYICLVMVIGYLKLKISITAEPIGLYSSWKIDTDSGRALGYFLVGRGGIQKYEVS